MTEKPDILGVPMDRAKYIGAKMTARFAGKASKIEILAACCALVSFCVATSNDDEQEQINLLKAVLTEISEMCGVVAHPFEIGPPSEEVH